MKYSHRFFDFVRSKWPIVFVGLFFASIEFFNAAEWGDRVPGAAVRAEIKKRSLSGDCDFLALYIGGLCAAENHWESLYDRNSAWLVGRLREKNAAKRYTSPWLYPPPAALLWTPFSRLDYPVAFSIWKLVNYGALILFLLVVDAGLSKLGMAGIKKNAIVLALGMGLPVQCALKSQNISILVATLLALALYSEKGAGLALCAATLLCGVTKALSVVWMPLFLKRNYRKYLPFVLLASAGMLVATWLLGCGVEAYSEFFRRGSYAKTTVYGTFANEGLPKLLLRPFSDAKIQMPHMHLPGSVSLTLNVILFVCCCLVYLANWRCQSDSEATAMRPVTEKRRVLGLSLFLLVAAFQLFSTVCWDIYRIHLMAFVPILLDATRKSVLSKCLFAIGFVVLSFVPTSTNLYYHVDYLPWPETLMAPIGYMCWIALASISLSKRPIRSSA